MKTSKNSTTSIFGLVCLGIFLIISCSFLLRGVLIDFTEDKLFSISDESEDLLSKLDSPVEIYFFYSDSLKKTEYGRYGDYVSEFLRKYEGISSHIRVKEISPEAFSDDEDRAMSTLRPIVMNGNAYLGAVIVGKTEVVIPIFDANRQSFLEYDLTEAIYKANLEQKKVVGLLDSFGKDNKNHILEKLKFLYDVRVLDIDFSYINDEIDTIIILQGEHFSQNSLYLLEQFVFRGGKLLLLLDPLTERYPQNPDADLVDTELLKTLSHWGIFFDPKTIIADKGQSMNVSYKGQLLRHYGVLGVKTINKDSAVVSNLSQINMSSVGYFSVDTSRVEVSELASSSDEYLLVHRQDYPKLLMSDGSERPNFPKNQPKHIAGMIKSKNVSSIRQNLTKVKQIREDHKEVAKEINLAVIADTNFLNDHYYIRQEKFYDEIRRMTFVDNASFFFNILDALTGNVEMLSIRKKSDVSKELDLISDIRKNTEAKLAVKENELKKNISQIEEKLSEIKKQMKTDQSVLLEEKELAEQMRIEEELIYYRKQLRQLIYSLENEIKQIMSLVKFISMFLWPLIVAIILLLVARRLGRYEKK